VNNDIKVSDSREMERAIDENNRTLVDQIRRLVGI